MAGGGSMFNTSIDLTIDIYCELIGVDKQELLDKCEHIHNMAWGDFTGDQESWQSRMNLYE